jgi:eukaryotic-like serine/threonine-protein kinase
LAGANKSHVVVDRLTVGPVTHLRLSGIVDETFSPEAISKDLAGEVLIDLGRVERISSYGVRQWISFSKALPKGATGLYLVNAPPMFVDQLALVEGFAGVAKVLSILAPYTCPKCNEDRLRLVDLRADEASLSKGEAPPHNCPVCASPLQFADMPEEYFAYARHNAVGEVSAAVDRYLKSLTGPTEQQGSSHLKLVEGDVTYIRLAGDLRADLNVRRLAGGLQGVVIYDLGHVTQVIPAAVPKVGLLLQTAASGAKVYLWRAPPSVLLTLSPGGLPSGVGVASVLVNCECLNCGHLRPQRVDAQAYLAQLRVGEALETPCPVCGGAARPALVTELTPVLQAHPAGDAPLDTIEALEPRALSRFLGGSSGGTPPKSDGSGSGVVKAPGPAAPQAPDEADRLKILRRIGQGGMAEVFLARQLGLKGFEKYVVLKKILPQFASQPEFVEMLFAEARSSARLTHPNIVQIYDVGLQGGSAYITMEYVRGADLRKLMTSLVKKKHTLPLEHALRIVAEVAAGLHYAHSYVDPTGQPHPVVHRDISPHNVLVSLDGAIKLSDFGIAKALDDREHTQPGMLKGKIAYMAPELVRGAKPDPRCDVFSLGVVLYELTTLRMPFRRENEVATLHAIVSEVPMDPLRLNPSMGPDVAAIIHRALEKDPRRRFQSADELRASIEQVMAHKVIASSPTMVAQYFQQCLPELAIELAPPAQPSPSLSSMPAVNPPTRSTPPPPPHRPPPPQPVSKQDASSPSVSILLTERAEEDQVETKFTPAPAGVAPPELRGTYVPGGTPSPAARPARVPEPSTQATVPLRPSGSYPAVPQAAPPPPPPATPAARRSSGQIPVVPAAASAAVAVAPAPAAPQLALQPPPVAPAPALATVAGAPWFKSKAVLGGAGAAVVLVLGAAAYLSWGGGGGRVMRVANAEPDERVYVSGVRVDGAEVRVKTIGPVLVAVARQGAMARYGQVHENAIDVSRLPELRVPPGEKATLSVNSDPKGCTVRISGTHQSNATPMVASIEAGRELMVEVMCAGLPRWSRQVMAAPAQPVELSARLFDEQP